MNTTTNQNANTEAQEHLQMLSNDLLGKIARGEVDVKELAMQVLEMRGCSAEGRWVGFGQPRNPNYFS